MKPASPVAVVRVLSAEPGSPHVDESTVLGWVNDAAELALKPAAASRVGSATIRPDGLVQFNPQGLDALVLARLPYLFYVPYLSADVAGARWHIDARHVSAAATAPPAPG